MKDTGNVKKIDTKKSKLVLEGSPKSQKDWGSRIKRDIAAARNDQVERKRAYDKRRDFILGNHDKYTNIYGLAKKAKKGHADQTLNYAGRSVEKIYHSIGNNPPNIKLLPLNRSDEMENINAQVVEDFIDRVFWYNHWWKRGYKRACMNQVGIGDFAVKVYYDPSSKEIRVVQAEKMENLLVGWRSDDALEYDWVAHTEMTSVDSIEREWGIKVEPEIAPKGTESSGQHGDEWNTENNFAGDNNELPKTVYTQPMVKVTEYATDKIYAIMIGSDLVQLVEHKYGFNPWVIGHSLHMPGKPWSKAFVDDLMSPNVELNEVMNDVRDFIRTASNAKYVAKNMSDFDPESIKTGSGQVIFIDGPDADFQSLEQRVNTFPGDTYTSRIKSFIHDLGVPQVAFGSAQSDSGKSKAIDYQTIVDIVDDLRDAWELVLEGVIERIQKLGAKYFDADYWKNPQTDSFEPRQVEFDWEDVLPTTKSEKIVDVLNKFQMGLPFRIVYEELGYKDVDAIIEIMRQEAKDPDLTTYRAKMYQAMPGLIEAMQKAQASQQPAAPAGPVPGPGPGVNTPTPTLLPSENGGRSTSLPVSVRGGTQTFSTPAGVIGQQAQNTQAQGG